MLTKTERILLCLFVLATGIGFMVFMLTEANWRASDKARQEKRTEADFVTKNYVVHSIWERQLTQQRGTFKQAYLFLKPEGEEFNLIFGVEATDYGKDTAVRDQLSRLLHPDAHITVKVDAISLAEAQSNSLLPSSVAFLATATGNWKCTAWMLTERPSTNSPSIPLGLRTGALPCATFSLPV
jgi:hypothetical protein